ncbi:hypothetical protein D3C87_2121200 [compost metagenome]
MNQDHRANFSVLVDDQITNHKSFDSLGARFVGVLGFDFFEDFRFLSQITPLTKRTGFAVSTATATATVTAFTCACLRFSCDR